VEVRVAYAAEKDFDLNIMFTRIAPGIVTGASGDLAFAAA
jgi:hypothetical protein